MTASTERLLYSQSAFPVFQNRMYDTAEDARNCPKGDIRLVEDLDTGLIHNAAFNPALVEYDDNYQNEQGLSAAFRDHLEHVAGLVTEHCSGKMIEVGCGKGTFLKMLASNGSKITGYDPTYEGSNPAIVKEYFREGIHRRASMLIVRHVLEHIPDPVSFLGRLRDANGGKGRIYIEVPCFDWIRTNRTWFDIFYEHVNYFRLSDFQRMFGKIVACGHVFGQQYIFVIAELESLRTPTRDDQDAAEFPSGFGAQIEGLAGKEKMSVIWGGASKGVIYALMRERACNPVQTVIDINPAKQGRYLPATGLCVSSPEEGLSGLRDGTRILVMNSNYLAEIRAQAGARHVCVGLNDE